MATETLRPNATGDECAIDAQTGCSACNGHFECVDEASSDGNTTRIQTLSATYLRDLYNVEASGVGAGDIASITVYVVCYGAGTPAEPSIKIAIKSGTGAGAPDTVDESSAIVAVDGSWREDSNQWAINPATSAAWTWDEIDKLQIGVALRESAASSGDYTACTQVYVEVDYTPAVVAPTVTTQAVSSIGTTTATGNGNITNTGGEDASAWGTCLATTANPDTGDTVDAGSGAGGAGAFTTSIDTLALEAAATIPDITDESLS